MDPIQERQQAQDHVDRIEGTTDENYLSKRSIKKETYHDLKILKVMDEAVSFLVYKDINEAGVGKVCSIATYATKGYYGSNTIGYSRNSPTYTRYKSRPIDSGLTILSPVSRFQEADRFVITESPIDALSHRQLERTGAEQWRVMAGAKQDSVSYDQKATVYLSKCGFLTGEMLRDLETVCQLAYKQGKTVVLAMNMYEGVRSEIVQTLAYYLEKIGTNYHIEEPTIGKYWNDTLRQLPFISQTVKEAAMRQREAALTQGWELFQAPRQARAYLDRIAKTTDLTYLAKRSIEKETYQDLEGLDVWNTGVRFNLYKDINEAGVGKWGDGINYTTERCHLEIGYFSGPKLKLTSGGGLSILSPVSRLQQESEWAKRSIFSSFKPANWFEKAERFVITENPIDALSYRQLERTGAEQWRVMAGAKQASSSYDPQATIYLSTPNHIEGTVKKDFETVFELAYQEGKTVVLAIARYSKGKAVSEMEQILVHMLKDIGVNYHIEKPVLGDWHDTLTLSPSISQTVKEAVMRQTQAKVTRSYELLDRVMEKTYQTYRFVLTQSPVDALSYRQLERTSAEEWHVVVGAEKKNDWESVSYSQHLTSYISTCENTADQIKKELRMAFELAYQEGKTVVLAAIDKDKAVSEMEQSLIHMIKEVGARTNYHIEEPTLGKEMNYTFTQPPFEETAMSWRQEAAMRWRQAELMSQKEAETDKYLRLLLYEHSVLPQLGIKQETIEGFRNQVETTKQSLVITLHPIGVNPEIKTRQAGVINNQEVSVEKPAQAVVGRWSLSVDQKGDIQLPVSEGLPPLATLKGEPAQASKVVLVCSPLDALLHYQSSIDRPLSESGQLLDSTSYVYVGQKDYAARHPFEAVTEIFKDKSLSLAIRGDHDLRFNSLEAKLQQQGVCYQKELIDTNVQVYKKLNLLASSREHKKLNLLERSLRLLQGVTGARGAGEERDGEGEEKLQLRNINKKQGYRPSL